MLVLLNFVVIAGASQSYSLDTSHPIEEGFSNTWSVPFPEGAQYVRFHIVRLEGDQATLSLRGYTVAPDGTVTSPSTCTYASPEGGGYSYGWTPWMTGNDAVKIHFTCESGYGFSIDKMESDVESDTTFSEESRVSGWNMVDVKSPKKTTPHEYVPVSRIQDTTQVKVIPSNNPTKPVVKKKPVPPPSTTVPETQHVITEKVPSVPVTQHTPVVQSTPVVIPAPVPTPVTPEPVKIKETSAVITFIATDVNVTIGQTIPVSYRVANKLTSEHVMHCQMIFETPSGVSVFSINTEGQLGQYTKLVDLAPGEANDIEAKITPNNEGVQTLHAKTIWYYGDDKKTMEEHDDLIVINTTPSTWRYVPISLIHTLLTIVN